MTQTYNVKINFCFPYTAPLTWKSFTAVFLISHIMLHFVEITFYISLISRHDSAVINTKLRNTSLLANRITMH